ncbi:MAG: lipoprotein-releasing ABC transporter permease subunit [Proteobacteria bacterium]|nr:lipoprotein-releasing ABC transporter permease subunit [Pseudomonadota bacterium]MBU1610997.1 lipoprotein-releasing ABC transporter permease subunit [Pseudomonadota bacterium]
MRFESIIATRYLFALRRQSFITLISVFAVCGVALGVASLIVVIGVMNGFSKDLQDKILGVNAHIVVGGVAGAIPQPEKVADIVRDIKGVTGVTPFLYAEAMVSVPGGGVKGVALRALDPATADSVLSISKDMVSGSVDNLTAYGDIPGVIIGVQMADRLGVTTGSEVYLLSPAGTRTAGGFSPKMDPFKVAGVFRTGLFEYDNTLGYVTLDAAAKLMGYPKGIVTGLEVRVEDVYAVEEISARIEEATLEYPVYVDHWQRMNANLFAALKLEKTAMFIILAMIVLVGSFSIVTTLVMLVSQKTKDIAILMSMGAEPSSIRKIFILQGTWIGLVGTTIGFILGVPVALILKKYQFIKLPKDVYPVDYLPIRLEAIDLTAIGLSALLLCFIATIYPAYKAAALRPADALRYE